MFEEGGGPCRRFGSIQLPLHNKGQGGGNVYPIYRIDSLHRIYKRHCRFYAILPRFFNLSIIYCIYIDDSNDTIAIYSIIYEYIYFHSFHSAPFMLLELFLPPL